MQFFDFVDFVFFLILEIKEPLVLGFLKIFKMNLHF